MKTSDKGRKFIEGFEGLILGAYDDATDRVVPVGSEPRGTLTIGYGHTDAAGPPTVHVGQTITRSEADTMLASDLVAVERTVARLVTVVLTQDQYDAIVSFEFNTGALERSTLLKHLNSGNYKAAADDFLVWNHANGQVMAGLTRRRQAERAMFLSSEPTSHVTTAVITGTTAGAVVVANHQSYEGLIVAGTIVAAAVVIGLIMHFYNKGKTNAVVSVQPVAEPQVHLV